MDGVFVSVILLFFCICLFLAKALERL